MTVDSLDRAGIVGVIKGRIPLYDSLGQSLRATNTNYKFGLVDICRICGSCRPCELQIQKLLLKFPAFYLNSRATNYLIGKFEIGASMVGAGIGRTLCKCALTPR